MRRLWLFNPENDLALAANTTVYTSPPAAARLRRSGAALPMWLGRAGDFFLCDGMNEAWFESVKNEFGIEANPWDHITPALPVPWGWSKSAKMDFIRAGVPEQALPPAGILDLYRNLSHRRLTVEIHRRLADMLPFEIWPGAVEVRSKGELERLLRKYPDGVIKLPWSSSGRGVTFTDAVSAGKAAGQSAGAISKYGSVLFERRAERMADFAMLFMAGSGGVELQGLSLFRTDERGNYSGNMVAPQHTLAAAVGAVYPLAQLYNVAEALQVVLTDVLGTYCGPVGVDMLVADGGGSAPLLHACVEVNLRYTMGFAALALERYAGVPALLTVERGDTTDACSHTSDGARLMSGRLALTPPGGDFTFVLAAQ